jgi:hypothetical protein
VALALSSGQSGESKNLRQPVGLISPLTTLRLRGPMKNEQTAQLNKPFWPVLIRGGNLRHLSRVLLDARRERSRDAAQGRDDQATPYQTAIGAKAALLTPAAPTALDPERALKIGPMNGR